MAQVLWFLIKHKNIAFGLLVSVALLGAGVYVHHLRASVTSLGVENSSLQKQIVWEKARGDRLEVALQAREESSAKFLARNKETKGKYEKLLEEAEQDKEDASGDLESCYSTSVPDSAYRRLQDGAANSGG